MIATDRQRLRILYVVHAYKPAYRAGGPVLSVSAAAERLVARGHRVTVFTTTANLDRDLDVATGRPTDVDGVEVWYFARSEPLQRLLPFVGYLSRSFGYLYAPALRAAVEQRIEDFDLVHTHMPYVYPTSVAARAAFAAGKPLFYHQRGVFDPGRLRFRGFKKRIYIAAVERPIMRRATTLIALTEAEEGSYRALGVTTPCRVIPNGVEMDAIPPSNGDGFNVGGRFIDPGATLVLFLGRLHPIKGADVLLDAFLRIADRVPNAVLVLAGPDEFDLEQTFRRQAASAGIVDRVVFPGIVTGDAKRRLLARADLFCLPSVAEGFSMAILEALASGTPVMISPGCHFPAVADSGAGWVVERDVDLWADALAAVLSSPEEIDRRRQPARDLVRESFSWDKVVDQLEDAYYEGIARHSRSR